MLGDKEIALLARYARPIYHMRSQLAGRKLVPIFGAGTSLPLKLPNWKDLVARISEHPEVSPHELAGSSASQTSKVQLVFNHFRRREFERDGEATFETTERERKIAAKWRLIVHDCLYRQAQPASTHPYLVHYLPLIRNAPLTINYNFDDTIQELLDQNPESQSSSARGFETIWEPTVQFRYSKCVLYHPNGFLPRRIAAGPSPRLVFLEDSFADQLIDAHRGHYATLLSHLHRFTGLLVGLSLEDPTLRHLLRQCTQSNPGHVHYYVAFAGKCLPSAEVQKAVRDSNFNTYNLVTLFCTEDEYASLGKLLSATDRDFAIAADAARQPPRFVYYLSGPVGSGKTTSLGAFKSLNTFDEWLEEKPDLLHRAASSLLPDEREFVDNWINKQMLGKNLLISQTSHLLSIVDRSPLDPIAFSWDRKSQRASELIKLYQESSARAPCDGMVILLRGSPDVLFTRTIDRHKEGSRKYLEELQSSFESLWNAVDKSVAIVDTVDVTIPEVVKRVARIVHLESYRPADLSRVAAKLSAAGSEGAK